MLAKPILTKGICIRKFQCVFKCQIYHMHAEMTMFLKYVNKFFHEEYMLSTPMESGLSEFGLDVKWIFYGRYHCQSSNFRTVLSKLTYCFSSFQKNNLVVCITISILVCFLLFCFSYNLIQHKQLKIEVETVLIQINLLHKNCRFLLLVCAYNQ